MAKGAFFHDIRWIPDEEDPENKKQKVVIPREKWPTLQDAFNDISKVLNLQIAAHEDKKTGETYLRGYTEEFGNGQFSLFSLRMRPVKTTDGEMEPKMVLDLWVHSGGQQGGQGGGGQRGQQSASTIDERLKAASTIDTSAKPKPAKKASKKAAKSGK